MTTNSLFHTGRRPKQDIVTLLSPESGITWDAPQDCGSYFVHTGRTDKQKAPVIVIDGEDLLVIAVNPAVHLAEVMAGLVGGLPGLHDFAESTDKLAASLGISA